MSAPTDPLKGLTRFTIQGINGLTRHIEQLHETIARRPLPWEKAPEQPTRAHGLIAMGSYMGVRATTSLVGYCLESLIDLYPGALPELEPDARYIQAMAALNGVCGDALAANDNPLAIQMSLYASCSADDLASNKAEALDLDSMDEALNLEQPTSPDIVILVHGLCMSQLQWQRNGQDLGSYLQQERGLTPLYLRYNSGRHISENGREFGQIMEQLIARWPVSVRSITLVGHSMGGLVIRSACHYAQENKASWLPYLKRAIYLGSPHSGAPLEKLGHLIDKGMRSIQYLEPLALGRYRSAGIQDLRHGYLLDEDWKDEDSQQRNAARTRSRAKTIPLLTGVEHYVMAAVLGKNHQDPLSYLFGDVLVRLSSATAVRKDHHKGLPLADDHCRIFHERNHFDLLYDPQVYAQAADWCATES